MGCGCGSSSEPTGAAAARAIAAQQEQAARLAAAQAENPATRRIGPDPVVGQVQTFALDPSYRSTLDERAAQARRR